MATLQVSRPDLETPLSSTLLTFSDISEMEINDKKVVAIICPQVSPGAYYPRCVSGSSSAFTQNGITASGSDSELDATVSSIYSEPTAHFVLTKTGISTYTLRSVGYNFYSPSYDAEETNGLAWVETLEEFTLSSPIISDTTGIAVNAMASNSSFVRFTESTAGKILSAGADASEFGFSSADDITSVWYVYEINGYVAEDLYTVTVTSNNSAYGTLSGAGNYTGGSTATISVTPAAGYKFLSWTDGNINDEREVIVDDDLSFRANLAPASGLTYAIKENLVTMWTSIKSYFSGTSGASRIGVASNNAVGATTVADVVGSIGQASGIATLDSTGKLDSNQLPSGLLSGTVGSTTTPVYLDNGTITAVGTSLAVDITGSAAKVGVATVGSSNQPVYMNAGTPTACGTSLDVNITGSAAKVGSTNVGSSNKPIYLSSGTATPVYQDIDPFDIPFFTVGEPSRLIAGSAMTEGYFGEVNGANFIYPWEVLAQIKSMNVSTLADFKTGFTSAYGSSISYTFTGDSYTALGITDNLECPWLKFYSRGKIIFVSKRPILNNITWNEINTMLGDVNVGFDIKIDTHRLNSNYGTTYENGRYATLKCRLLTGANNQPITIGNVYDRGKSGVELGRGSEWNRLMYRICSQIPTDTNAGAVDGYSGGKQIGDNWAENTAQSLGFGADNDVGRLSWCREYCWYQNTFYCCTRSSESGVGFVGFYSPSGRYTFTGFRPALVFDCNPQMNIVQVPSVPSVQASNTLYIITQ